MELLYLWIENDGMTIKNQSFNFSNHITFEFDNTSEYVGNLTLTENSNFISNFFGNNLALIRGEKATQFDGKIVNVTGIIGENGVGKTNLLSFIIDLFTDRLPTGEKFIIAFKDERNKSIKIFHTIKNFILTAKGSISDYKIENPIEQTISFRVSNYIKDPNIFLHNFGLIFYSPVFDLRNYPPNISNEYKEYIDVSTNALIENDVIRSGDTYPDEVREIQLHKSSNIRRQFDMVINSGLADIEGINLPNEVSIQFHRSYFDPNAGKRNLTFNNEAIFEHLDKLTTEAWKIVNSALYSIEREYEGSRKIKSDFSKYSKIPEYRKALSEKLKVEFSYSLIHNYFYNLSEHYNEEIGIKLEDIQGNNLFERAGYFFENQKWKGREPYQKVEAGLLYSSIFNLIEAVNFDKNWIEDNAHSFVTGITGGVVAINNYENYISSIPSDHKKNFISISWRNISSGENALMDLYSRLYFAKNYKLKEQIKKRSLNIQTKNQEVDPITFLYILIDEGEVGFHPQWQSQYLYNLTNFIRHLFSEYEVQVILTSHSPFIVSDLPKENLIFLKKENGNCKVVSFNEEQTFAANIHTLLSNQFFMQDGVVGKFAKTKLHEELKPLLDKNQKNVDEDRLRKIIALIGEPVLQSKLTEILNSKLKK
ncbi:AAA family ATPase [Larkinella terrae]|uniref:AAA family ATPase n=1 Tax=Larkinella terrae TaxID=2025311 RepID=A0A7K0EEA8_9BACT|nr:AAA family ATPase [Larkinella terrae]MRS59796.1 AAA family ATPase [Larkinella terrae]